MDIPTNILLIKVRQLEEERNQLARRVVELETMIKDYVDECMKKGQRRRTNIKEVE